jgi:hypothetical protein
MSTESPPKETIKVECANCHHENEVALDDRKDAACTECDTKLFEGSTAIVDLPPGPKRAAVEKAAEGRKDLTDEDVMDATAWFLEEEPEGEAERAVKTLEIDVGIEKPRIIRWVVGSLDRERIAEIRTQAREQVAKRRGRRRSQDPFDDSDEMIANVRIAAEGTITPDLRDSGVRGKYADPADALKHKFRHKSGIIDQLAGAVIKISGYSAEDVQEVDAVKG